MKATIIGILLIINLILQSTLFQYFAIFGVLPNTALVLIVSISIFTGKGKGAITGFVAGLLQDIIFGKMVGLNAMIYMLIGYTMGSINEKLYKDNPIVPILLTAASTVAFETINMVFLYLMRYRIELFNVFKNMLIIEVLYNSFLSIFIYLLISKLYKTNRLKKRY
ncbi:rod shape-determining protein MreD [Alkaliphilus serpentinus]|uniref:Rod shape-determining protein MreD n=1 Tax=Alkaliphilus serpentinus TaxID=1482731 RepID=A0A833M8P2_9FIRM|nr:rod shape-determining protein MreD [Alkaliphilus serpentinus]KAB3531441.1 rod shape-determining protein MreD [Alkaliphilus serpentinus]